MNLEELKNLISKLSLNDIEELLCTIVNKRDDVYLEWLTANNFDNENAINLLWDANYDFINDDEINELIGSENNY